MIATAEEHAPCKVVDDERMEYEFQLESMSRRERIRLPCPTPHLSSATVEASNAKDAAIGAARPSVSTSRLQGSEATTTDGSSSGHAT